MSIVNKLFKFNKNIISNKLIPFNLFLLIFASSVVNFISVAKQCCTNITTII